MNTTAFIDLQGTLGGDPMGDIRDFTLYPFSIDAIKVLNSNNIKVIILTNQSRIGKGYLTSQEFHIRLNNLLSYLESQGAVIDGTYMCPHVREDNCLCKKPLRGMVDSAINDHDIQLDSSYVIGDMGISDMILAHNIGAKGILVKTGAGEGSLFEFRHTWSDYEPYHVSDDILQAAHYIVND